MSHQFRARLASIRTTPSRSDDAKTVTRVLLEAHDTPLDPLGGYIDAEVYVTLQEADLPRTPLESAIERANGANQGPVDEIASVPSAGRRRRGSRANPTEDE
jgi:hypothetical protein